MSETVTDAVTAMQHDTIVARPTSVFHDIASVAGRAVRAIPREPEAVIPALLVPVFFFVVNTGALQKFTERSHLVTDFKAFQLPVAIVFASTGVSRASALVTDIQGGYFERLLLTPVRRLPLLLGLLVADLVLIVALTIPVILLGLVLGVRFKTGPLGLLLFIVLAGTWGLCFNGFTYAIALKTGNPAAVNSAFVIFFPFAFLTTAFLPKEALTGWLAAVATWNPVTYLLAGLRSLVISGWDGRALLEAGAAIAAVGVVSLSLSIVALKSRVTLR
jgi:ABC-2 type transport system permease protein